MDVVDAPDGMEIKLGVHEVPGEQEGLGGVETAFLDVQHRHNAFRGAVAEFFGILAADRRLGVVRGVVRGLTGSLRLSSRSATRHGRIERVNEAEMIEPSVCDPRMKGVAQEVIHAINAEGVARDNLNRIDSQSVNGSPPKCFGPTAIFAT